MKYFARIEDFKKKKKKNRNQWARKTILFFSHPPFLIVKRSETFLSGIIAPVHRHKFSSIVAIPNSE